MTSLRTFYMLVITQTLSLIGSKMTGLALGIWIFAETGKTTPLMLVAVFQTLPMMLGGSVAGVFADRWNRKAIMVTTDFGQALATLVLVGAFLTDQFSLPLLYVMVMIQATLETLQSPAVAATTSLMVPEDELDRANTVRQLSMPLAGIIAPAITGVLYATVGVTGVMSIDLATFLIAVGVVSVLTIPQPEVTAESEATKGTVLQEIRGAWRFLRDRPAMLALIFFATFINFILNGSLTLSVPYILSITDSEAAVGILQTILNAGMVVGGVLFGMWGGTRPRIHSIMGGIFLMAVFLMIYGVARSPLALGLALFFILFPNPAINSMFMSITQLKTPPDMQGRVFALIMQFAMFATPLSLLVTGQVVDRILEPAVGTASWWGTVEPLVGNQAGAGMGLWMVLAGGILTIVTLIMYSVPNIRTMEADLPDYMPTTRELDSMQDTDGSADTPQSATVGTTPTPA